MDVTFLLPLQTGMVPQRTHGLILVSVMPHQPKHEQLAIVIPSDIAKPNRRAIEFEFTKERPLW